jgi:hypothetical protein
MPGSGGGYQRYPGGVYVPSGGSPWGYYPFHYFWWLGVPRPFGYGYGHASILGTMFTMVLLILLLAVVGLGVAWIMRRGRRPSGPRWEEMGEKSGSPPLGL